jgi:predicted acetyltransferase
MAIEIRAVTDDEFPAMFRALHRGFGEDPPEDDADGASLAAVLPAERTVAAFDGTRIVGTLGDFSLLVYLPGGALVPMAGTTVVTVASTHRRQGVLTAMMQRHLDIAVDRGDPLAGLWASETPIYGRFGFGCAADELGYEFPGDQVVIPPPEDVSVELLDDGTAAEVLPPIFERVARRPGTSPRTPAWWENHTLRDSPSRRHGRSALRHAVAVRGGERVGYASYRLKHQWEEYPDGTVSAQALFAADTGVRRALVHYLANIDLFPNVGLWRQPVDDPLVWEVADRRRLKRHLNDSLWLRILDVPAALGARTYEADGRLVIGIDDLTRPSNSGTFELVVEEGAASCTPTSADPEVAMGIGTLAALYLGGRSAVVLHRAGLVSGTRPEIARLDNLFRTAAAPWCPEVF